jgi:hypothetical protein
MMLALVCALALGACGGGGGGGAAPQPAPPPPPPALLTQEIAFVDPGVIDRTLGQGDFINTASGGAGTGAITYASSDTSVVTVNATTGAVTVIAPGVANITATKAADAVYASATRSYPLIIQRPAGVPFTASLSEAGAAVEFPAWARGLDFLRSTQADCDVAQFTSCANNQVNSITALARTFTDTAATVTREALWWLRRGTTLGAPLSFSPRKFPARSAPALASFRGKLWLVGGLQTNVYLADDVWNSTDGVNWSSVPASGQFPARSRAQLLAFNDRLWLIAGNGGNGGNGNGLPTSGDVWLSDVWSSADGATWRLETANAPFGGRFDHAALVFAGRMWVIGGTTPGSSGSSDAWSTTDGINWTPANNSAPFGARTGHTVSALNGRMWLIGGRNDAGTLLNDVWSSADGVTWAQETASAAFAGRAWHAASAVSGRLMVVGGTTAVKPYSGEIWSSTDGITWTGAEYDHPLAARTRRGVAVHENLLFMAGGEYRAPEIRPQGGGELFLVDEVYALGDTFLDSHRTPYARFPPGSTNVQVFNGRLYLFRGFEDAAESRFVWSSTDGHRWLPSGAGNYFDDRAHHAVTVFDGRLWVAGGEHIRFDGLHHWYRDVWQSADGINWTRTTAQAPWDTRIGLMLTSFNGLLILVGGRNDAASYLNDVWTSSDGINWTQLTAAAGFSARSHGTLLVYDGRLWIFGGRSASGLESDAWSSADGITWQREELDLPVGAREGAQVAVHNDRLWITGGRFYVPAFYGYDYATEVYSSEDGRNWARANYTGRRFSPRRNAGIASFAGNLWVIGGIDDFGPRSDVWTSPDGESWSVKVAGTLPYP